jgi:hypothetical protein
MNLFITGKIQCYTNSFNKISWKILQAEIHHSTLSYYSRIFDWIQVERSLKLNYLTVVTSSSSAFRDKIIMRDMIWFFQFPMTSVTRLHSAHSIIQTHIILLYLAFKYMFISRFHSASFVVQLNKLDFCFQHDRPVMFVDNVIKQLQHKTLLRPESQCYRLL